MCRNYDAGECVEEGCTGRITCRDFHDKRCTEHSINGRNGPYVAEDGEDDRPFWAVDWATGQTIR